MIDCALRVSPAGFSLNPGDQAVVLDVAIIHASCDRIETLVLLYYTRTYVQVKTRKGTVGEEGGRFGIHAGGQIWVSFFGKIAVREHGFYNGAIVTALLQWRHLND
jgi:hypothetical protein